MEIAEQLEKLESLRASGSLSDVEFHAAKAKLLNSNPQPPHKVNSGMVHGLEERTWCTLMHVSQLLVYSAIGIIVPIAMWILGKDKSDMVRRHGNRMMNWIISGFIYGCVAALLWFVVIGIPISFGLFIMSIAFPIIAAVKANNGETWSYPLAIRFLSED